MAARLFPEARLEVPVVALLHQWDKAAGVWLHHVPGNAHGHSWGCQQGEVRDWGVPDTPAPHRSGEWRGKQLLLQSPLSLLPVFQVSDLNVTNG